MKMIYKTQFLLDLTIASIFAIFSMTIMRLIFPDGFVTQLFLLRASKLLVLVFIALGIIFLISWFFNKNFKFKNKIDLPELKDLILIALPMSPVFDYILLNSQYLDLNGLLYLFIITLIFSLFISFMLPILFSCLASLKILMISGLALSFTVLTMAKIANNPANHVFNSQFITQGLYLIVSFSVVYLLYLFNKKVAYTIVFFFMIAGLIVNFSNYSSKNLNVTQQQDPERLNKFLSNKNNNILKKKNIYILVYESYANLETLKYYGFDNTNQIKFLEKNGFKVHHGIYSNGSLSLDSTSRLLEIKGKLSKHARHYTSGNAFGLDIFKANGYSTLGLFKSSYFFGSSPINWDTYYPKGDITKIGGKTLTKTIFEGEFRFDIFDDFYDYKKYLQLKEKYLSSNKKKTLLYTHNNYPGHSGNTGKCATDEKQKYFKGIKKANLEMKNDVLNVLENDPNSIIVLLSDHGPYLTKNCRDLKNYKTNTINKFDLQDRYGAFLSIYWPEDIFDAEHNILIIQDIFPAILANITNNKSLFNELKVESKFFDRYQNIVNGINVVDGIIKGGKDDGKPLFDKRSYNLAN